MVCSFDKLSKRQTLFVEYAETYNMHHVLIFVHQERVLVKPAPQRL